MSHTEIKTFEDACAKLGIEVPQFVTSADADSKAVVAFQKLTIIARALNNGWVPDWTNGIWDKYYPWFRMNSSAVGGFSYGDCGVVSSTSVVGSRLCYVSREVAKYAGTQFTDLYKDFLTL